MYFNITHTHIHTHTELIKSLEKVKGKVAPLLN